MEGPFGETMTSRLFLVKSKRILQQEQGLIWKIWTENADTKQNCGIYLFEDIENAK